MIMEKLSIGYMMEINISYWLHTKKKLFGFVTFWRETLRIGYILEMNLSYWLHTGEKPYVLVTN